MFEIDQIEEVATYFGDLVYKEEFNNFVFETPHTNSKGKRDNRFFKAFGDVVYFMYVDDRLVKIGKAGGSNGFAGRLGTYTAAEKHHDTTNRMFIRKLKEMNQTTIKIFAVSVPRPVVNVKCPLTGTIINIESETLKVFESKYTEMAMAAGYDLPLCTQKK